MFEYINSLKNRLDIQSNPFLRALREGTMRRADFLETQIQFFSAVTHFPRPIMVLASRIPRADVRLHLLRNIEDEHGRGNASISHDQTFLGMLDDLGASPNDIERRAMWPEVRAFNNALSGVCQSEDPHTALATLGIIEDLFSGISEELGRSIVARNWLPARRTTHYAKNEVLDVEHAEAIYFLLESAYLDSPRCAYQIQQGLELGAYLLLRLYTDLYRARSRRWYREIQGPHTQVDAWLLPDEEEAQ